MIRTSAEHRLAAPPTPWRGRSRSRSRSRLVSRCWSRTAPAPAATCGGCGRQVGAGRLHAAGQLHQPHDQRDALSQAAVRSARRLHADQHDRDGAEPAGRQSTLRQVLEELIALAKAKPDTVDQRDRRHRLVAHLVGDQFKMMADVRILNVPYKGTAPALTDVLGGQVDTISSKVRMKRGARCPGGRPHRVFYWRGGAKVRISADRSRRSRGQRTGRPLPVFLLLFTGRAGHRCRHARHVQRPHRSRGPLTPPACSCEAHPAPPPRRRAP